MQAELYKSENVILRLNKIIPPENLRAKIIRITHKQGHLGLSKTKEVILQKCWWPQINIEIEDAVKRCFECQISPEMKHTEPAKMTKLPSRLWSTMEVDFCGPFSNGSYALVMIDQYSYTTSFEATRTKLKKIFAIHSVPKALQSNNGSPFNSHAFSDFA